MDKPRFRRRNTKGQFQRSAGIVAHFDAPAHIGREIDEAARFEGRSRQAMLNGLVQLGLDAYRALKQQLKDPPWEVEAAVDVVVKSARRRLAKEIDERAKFRRLKHSFYEDFIQSEGND